MSNLTVERIEFERCPVCGSQSIVRLPDGWNGDRAIPIVACGNPFHYTEQTLGDSPAVTLAGEGAPPVPAAPGLDVDSLGYDDLLDVATAILDKYPPGTIVCSHREEADIGARTTAAIADLIDSARLARHPADPEEA